MLVAEYLPKIRRWQVSHETITIGRFSNSMQIGIWVISVHSQKVTKRSLKPNKRPVQVRSLTFQSSLILEKLCPTFYFNKLTLNIRVWHRGLFLLSLQQVNSENFKKRCKCKNLPFYMRTENNGEKKKQWSLDFNGRSCLKLIAFAFVFDVRQSNATV